MSEKVPLAFTFAMDLPSTSSSDKGRGNCMTHYVTKNILPFLSTKWSCAPDREGVLKNVSER